MELTPRRFAGRVWGNLDVEESRQLVDHYLGNLGLSRLELAVTALKCLYNRETTEYLAGDQAYALMGLLRLRPQVDHTDTPFQAFARHVPKSLSFRCSRYSFLEKVISCQ